ncbi:PREDICTED: transforming growth factor beta receptor type 3-like [Gekko japonicus]|uniref:Transforming growth factor beta receptor type 3-like n=1 Tax=Gekko japonicus TaxID=146911 RepID=A0ABM1KNM8_GEKJA|nr:PREDICTED: transforming growth factor beta receptor type 3-like [Gekko japonicus]
MTSFAALWHHPSCLPMSASTTPQPVLGFWERPRKGTGCTSQEHSTTGQEVHVISLRGGVPLNAQVTLVLGSDPTHRAPIFVLHSQEPLHWMLPSPPGKNWTFQVSLGSSVSALGLVASAEINFPETTRSLLQWARREHGGVTSLAEYHGVNTIYTRLGADGTAPATCKLRRNFLRSSHFASERRLQPLRICLNSDPPQDLEVHIIFSKGMASRGLAHLTVELHALKKSPRRGLLLILKSEGTAQWMVHAHHLTGQLHVLASHKVVVSSMEMDLSLTVTQRTSSGLARIRDPLQWVARQKLPVFTSYTEAEHVNRFLLIVGMNGATTDPEPFGPMFLPPTTSSETQQHLPEAVTVGWARRQEFLTGDSTSLLLLPTAKTGAKGAEAVLCPREQQHSRENKDIQSVSCVSPSSTQASPPEATMAFQDLPFHLGNVLLSLEVYNSEAFAKQPGPCVVSANSRVFVEAALAAYDLCLGFTIWQCSLSPFSDASLSSPYVLIERGCVADARVTLSESEQAAQGHVLPPGYQERQRMSFVLQPLFNDSIQFLHCHLTLCSREPWDPTKPKGPIPKCQSENEACKGEEELASGRFQRTISKPIMVTVEIPPRAAAPNLTPGRFLLNQQGKALKDVNRSRKTQPIPTTAAPHLELPAVVGIAFSAFIIGISLTGGLWFIHSQTGGCKAAHSATDPEETAVSKPLDTPSAPTATGPPHGSPPY